MGSFSIWHWIIVLAIVLLLFGAGKLPSVMGDIAKGVKAFKAGMKDEDEATAPPPPATTQPPPAAPYQTAAHPAAIDPVPPSAVSPADPAKPHQG